jgi:hypothetical protein
MYPLTLVRQYTENFAGSLATAFVVSHEAGISPRFLSPWTAIGEVLRNYEWQIGDTPCVIKETECHVA